MSKISTLPTRAAGQHYALRKAGRFWVIDIVTPREGARSLRTKVGRFASRDDAIAYGEFIAVRLHRPFKIGGKAQ